MVNANRILTVSYGTFSCTLEGFDEPFSTMKSIAEYFRDLAADDRYFGAEPPTPDAEMLHRIAEREIQRRVESRVSDTGIVLRPMEQAPAAAPTVAPEAAPTAEPSTGAGDMSGSFSDKLERIRAVTARSGSDYAEDEHAEPFFVDTPIETAFADIDEDGAGVADAEDERDTADEATEAPDDDDDMQDRAEAADAEARAYAPDDEDTFAGAAVDQPASAGTETDTEDEPADLPAPALGDDDAAITAVLGSLGHPPVMEETVLDPDPAGGEADAGEADGDDSLFADLDEADDTAEVAPAATDAGEADEPAPPADEDAPEAEAAEDEAAADETAQDETAQDDPAQDVAPDAEAETPEAAPAPVQPRRPVARVVKVRRATAEEAKKPIEVPGISTLSEEDEAALAAELAEVQADADRETPEATPADPLAIEGEDEPTDRIAARKEPARTAFDDVDMSETEVAIDRILEKTNTQLKSGEATRRRSAIQHLKAAVQATRADREAAGETGADDDPREAYRDDLARVVQPRRPGGDGTSRRMAPLVLVSEQRIDEAEDAAAEARSGEDTPRDKPRVKTPAQQVRPRRVTKGNLALSPDLSVVEDTVADRPAASDAAQDQAPLIDGFRRYLADSDAEGDVELLEAAMAFVTQEVGRANVTRPQLMTLVMNAEADLSREDALRAFGTLLREGRIEKIKRGQFVLGEASRFFDPDD